MDDLYLFNPLCPHLCPMLSSFTVQCYYEGCCHGELNKIYDALLLAQQKEGITIDLLICCGDFQAVRNEQDLICMAVPQKYRQLMDFHEYYSEKKQAPILTLFIGGNHEASNHLWELGFGGWVAPNIYYLGYCGVVVFGGVRIAGLSGIYKQQSYHLNHFERPPYNPSTIRSAYHVRSCDQYRLNKLSGDIDIMLSHDWPQGIEHHGNLQKLLRWKPHFTDDVNSGALGSPPAMELLRHLKPTYWFSAHLHVKYPALYQHGGGQKSTEEGQSASVEGQGAGHGFTKFLSLNKCLPRRSYLQIVEVATDTDQKPYKLTYDPEWLTILRTTESLMHYDRSRWTKPSTGNCNPATREEVVYTEATLFNGNLTIPTNFVQTCHAPGQPVRAELRANPQTELLCSTLGICNPFQCVSGDSELIVTENVDNPDEISLDDCEVAMDMSNQDAIPIDGFIIDKVGTKRPSLSLPPPANQSHDMPSESHDTPPGSHDMTPGSHDMAPGSHDMPSESHDMPSGSHDTPSESHDMPPESHDMSPGSHDMPSESNDMPPESHDMPNQSYDMSPGSHDMPNQSHDMSPGSHDMPNQSHDMPPGSHDMPPGSHDMSPGSHDMPNQSQDTQFQDMPNTQSSQDALAQPKIKRRNIAVYTLPAEDESHDDDTD